VIALRLSWWAKISNRKRPRSKSYGLAVSVAGRGWLGTVETIAPALPRLPDPVELPAKGHSGLTEAQFCSLRGKFPDIDIQEMEGQFVAWNAANDTKPENYVAALYPFIKQKLRRDGTGQ
jgi:hypothetical protein